MAKSNAVWGIDIGQCALKALQCRPHEKDPDRVVVESFDYIEYPKILSQPEAEPEELVREALEQFLARNDLTGDHVAISVAGQSGLARFIKLPPVESKKIPDIVKYEARQQIPFSLDDVVWDYQQLTGGSEEDGFALEPEVGLFAMKRDQVARALRPLDEAGIEVDYIQLMPLAVYNFVCFDRLGDFKSTPYDPQNPPQSTVVISLGTDTTDLVVTNGYRVWQRNIPIGGSHFTRALSKELKLTFVKAEHLKRNATEADDPKAVFQAMRPVFSDLVAEIQRSLGYFTSLDKAAKIGNVIALGNGMKLPGLQGYLSQNLEHKVIPVQDFEKLSAGSAAGRAQYKENILSFAVAYGLCVQGLGKSEIRTNLLPEEIVRTRLVRAKKPWAVAGVAAILLGITFNYFSYASAWNETTTQQMVQAEKRAEDVQSRATRYEADRTTLRTSFESIEEIGKNLVSNVEGRLRWLELVKAIDTALPRDTRPAEEREETAEDISSRKELIIESMETQHFDELSEWFANVQSAYSEYQGEAPAEDTADPTAFGEEATAFGGDMTPNGGEGGGLSGPGWVVQLTGHHYHNKDTRNQSAVFVRNTFLKKLEEGTVELPDGPNEELISVPMKDLAISHPWVVDGSNIETVMLDPEEKLEGALPAGRGGGFGGEGGMRGEGRMFRPGTGRPAAGTAAEEESTLIEVRRYDFVVQFVWQPKTRAERVELAELRRQREEAAALAEHDELEE